MITSEEDDYFKGSDDIFDTKPSTWRIVGSGPTLSIRVIRGGVCKHFRTKLSMIIRFRHLKLIQMILG